VFLASGRNCVAPATSLQKLTSGVYLPLICFGLILFTALIHALICYVGMRFPDRVSPRIRAFFGYTFMKSPYLRTCINLVVWSYNSIVGAVVRFFSCQNVGPYAVLPEYPDVDCYSDDYGRLRTIYYGLAFAVVIGVPLALLVGTTTLHCRGLLKRGPGHEARYEKLRTRYGVLFEVYRPNRFFWEVSVLLRRSVLTAIFVALPASRSVKCAAIVIANVAFLFIHMLGKPYISSLSNLFESLSIATLTIVAAVLSVTTPPLDLPIAIGITVLVFGIGGIFFIYFLRKLRRDIRVRIDRIRHRKTNGRDPDESFVSGSANDGLLDASYRSSESGIAHDYKPLPSTSSNNGSTNQSGNGSNTEVTEISMKLMKPLRFVDDDAL
jgi:hypothetical protein